ncbi:hypothetical protein BS47DRAFT_894247 [Hydnum rufescens UP504]|uniref:Uncharacterized protein n=1 Tax=Hydnum rufescens UP504 TaxID=1448309 RepID=A0A9P6DXV5_9AGAM|nr:hypothetical protein BS47DRAFT_894247 [Hydnum rufescens UP504]
MFKRFVYVIRFSRFPPRKLGYNLEYHRGSGSLWDYCLESARSFATQGLRCSDPREPSVDCILDRGTHTMSVLKRPSTVLESRGPHSCYTGTDRNETIVQIMLNGESAKFGFEPQGHLSAIIFCPWSHHREVDFWKYYYLLLGWDVVSILVILGPPFTVFCR